MAYACICARKTDAQVLDIMHQQVKEHGYTTANRVHAVLGDTSCGKCMDYLDDTIEDHKFPTQPPDTIIAVSTCHHAEAGLTSEPNRSACHGKEKRRR